MMLPSVTKRLCENLKLIIDTNYSDFDESDFQNMKWFDPQTQAQKQQEIGEVTSFYEHFKEPLYHVNLQLSFCLKRVLKI